MSALVVLSGGMDSTVCLAWACREYGAENVYALTFDYGQRHRTEIDAARQAANHFQVSYDVHPVPSIRHFFASANVSLVNTEREIEHNPKTGLPNSFVPGRNLLFLTLAAMKAYSVGARTIILGANQVDYSGYPDCRDVVLQQMATALQGGMDYSFWLDLPLIDMTKKEIWALADSLHIAEWVYENTVTCYEGIRGTGCGKCPACQLRADGWSAFQAEKEDNQNVSVE